MSARGLAEDMRPRVAKMLRKNMWTLQQFRDLTGLKEGSITNKTRPTFKEGEVVTDLDFCYPFEDLKGTGPKMIVRNEKSIAALP